MSELQASRPATIERGASMLGGAPSRAIAKIEKQTINTLAVLRSEHIIKGARVESDRQLGGQVIDSVGDVTERALRRYEDIQETAKLRPGSDPLDEEERHVLQIAGLVAMRGVIGTSSAVMTQHAFGNG